MDMTVEEAVSRLKRKRGYRKQFRKAFGREITGEDLARALASYVRTILSGDSPFDRYLYGDREALPQEAQEGLRLFRGKANCSACHVGPHLTDEQFHNTGVAWRDGQPLDEGRFAVTGKEEDRGAFKTPTLREIVRTAPYMHDGSIAALEDVIDFYNDGGRRNPHLDEALRPLRLSNEEKNFADCIPSISLRVGPRGPVDFLQLGPSLLGLSSWKTWKWSRPGSTWWRTGTKSSATASRTKPHGTYYIDACSYIDDRGRDTGHPAPPAQIPTCTANASGSYLG